LTNAVWAYPFGSPPQVEIPNFICDVAYAVSSSNAESAETALGVYRDDTGPDHVASHPKLDALVGYAIQYSTTSSCRTEIP